MSIWPLSNHSIIIDIVHMWTRPGWIENHPLNMHGRPQTFFQGRAKFSSDLKKTNYFPFKKSINILFWPARGGLGTTTIEASVLLLLS